MEKDRCCGVYCGHQLAEEAADDVGAGAVVVHGGHEVGQAVAQIVHLPVQALDVAASLLEQLRRRRLQHASFTSDDDLVTWELRTPASKQSGYISTHARKCMRRRTCKRWHYTVYG